MLMLVSFYLCHCSLLCFSDFLVILSAIYQRKEKEQKKGVVSLHYGLCQRFLKENVLCVFSFCAVKMSLLSIEII